MANNLPLNISRTGSSSKPSVGVNHAQDFSVSILNQKKDRDNAKVSVNEVGRGSDNRPVTSIWRVGKQQNPASTSISHPGYAGENSLYSEDADERRYAYIRRLVKERQAREVQKQSEAVSAEDHKFLKIGTGKTFQLPYSSGLKKQFYKLKKQNPGVYKNLKGQQREYFLQMLKKHATAMPTGYGFGRPIKKKMKYQMEMDRRKGIIDVAAIKDFRKMIDNLPN